MKGLPLILAGWNAKPCHRGRLIHGHAVCGSGIQADASMRMDADFGIGA
jgi:murein endopeptidase